MTARVHFACCECGRVMTWSGRRVTRPDPPFCLACMNLPGWFRSLPLRLRIAPRHPGTEPQLATVPEWSPAS